MIRFLREKVYIDDSHPDWEKGRKSCLFMGIVVIILILVAAYMGTR